MSLLPRSADQLYACYYLRNSVLEQICSFAFHLIACVVDSDRLCLMIRDRVFFLFHLWGGCTHSFSCDRGPSVCAVEWKLGLSVRRVCDRYVSAGYFRDACQGAFFQTVSFLSLSWLGFTAPGPKGLTPLSSLFPLLTWRSATVMCSIGAFRSSCEFAVQGITFKTQRNALYLYFVSVQLT